MILRYNSIPILEVRTGREIIKIQLEKKTSYRCQRNLRRLDALNTQRSRVRELDDSATCVCLTLIVVDMMFQRRVTSFNRVLLYEPILQ